MARLLLFYAVYITHILGHYVDIPTEYRREFDGVYDADDGGQFVGLTSFRLTTSETGITTSLFVKTFNSFFFGINPVKRKKI